MPTCLRLTPLISDHSSPERENKDLKKLTEYHKLPLQVRLLAHWMPSISRARYINHDSERSKVKTAKPTNPKSVREVASFLANLGGKKNTKAFDVQLS